MSVIICQNIGFKSPKSVWADLHLNITLWLISDQSQHLSPDWEAILPGSQVCDFLTSQRWKHAGKEGGSREGRFLRALGPIYTRTLASKYDKIFYQKCPSFRQWRFLGLKNTKIWNHPPEWKTWIRSAVAFPSTPPRRKTKYISLQPAGWSSFSAHIPDSRFAGNALRVW